MIRAMMIALLIVFTLLGVKFWYGNDSLLQVMSLKKNLQKLQNENMLLKQRNELIKQRIAILKKDPNALEEQARYELGMIKRGEKFYQIVEPLE